MFSDAAVFRQGSNIPIRFLRQVRRPITSSVHDRLQWVSIPQLSNRTTTYSAPLVLIFTCGHLLLRKHTTAPAGTLFIHYDHIGQSPTSRRFGGTMLSLLQPALSASLLYTRLVFSVVVLGLPAVHHSCRLFASGVSKVRERFMVHETRICLVKRVPPNRQWLPWR